jgi:hypothetical protein
LSRMDSVQQVGGYEVTLNRGPRLLRVRERFTSLEAARGYVREQWTRRSLGGWLEPDLASSITNQHMIIAGRETYWIRPLPQGEACPLPQPTSASPIGIEARSADHEPCGLTYEAWLNYVFDHPVSEDSSDAWYWNTDSSVWDESARPHTTVRYLTWLFEDPSRWLQPFSDAQVAHGLSYLIDGSSDHMFPLMDPVVPWADRQRCIRAMYVVFERVFAPRCTPCLSHVRTARDPSVNPLNEVCYMWWDICQLRGHFGPAQAEDFVLDTEELVNAGPGVDPFAADLEDAIFYVLRRTLELESVTCQEAVLHGLGHRKHKFSERVASIVDEYLQNRFPTWPEDELAQNLRGYALAARSGRVQ